MSVRMIAWVWDHSPYDGNTLLMHLALADFADDDGYCWPSQERIAAKVRCTVESVRRMTRRMEADGLLVISQTGRGRGRSSRYQLTTKTPQQSGVIGEHENPTALWGFESENPTADSRKPHNGPLGNRQEPSVTTTDPSGLLPTGSDVDPFGRPVTVADEPESDAKRAQRLTKVYTSRVPLSKFPAVMGIVRKAITAGYDDEQIGEALAQLAEEGRPVTVDTLRIQMEGLPVAQRRLSRSEQKVSEVVSLIESAAARDAARERKGVTA